MLNTTVHCAQTMKTDRVAIYGHATDTPGLAVTPYLGNNNYPMRVDTERWVLTHLATGRVVGPLSSTDPADTINLANRLGPAADWQLADPVATLNEAELEEVRNIIREWDRERMDEHSPAVW